MKAPIRMAALLVLATALIALQTDTRAAGAPPQPGEAGLYDLTLLQGGIGMTRGLTADSPLLVPGAAWSASGWFKFDIVPRGTVVLAGIGDPETAACLCLQADASSVSVRINGGRTVQASLTAVVGAWHALAATYDGHIVRLFIDGTEVAHDAAAPDIAPPPLAALLQLAPVVNDGDGPRHFGGSLARFGFSPIVPAPAALRSFAADRPRFDLVHFTAVGVGWPVQVHAWTGLQTPQDPWTLPQSKTPASAPQAQAPHERVALQPVAPGVWTLHAWRLAAAPGVVSDARELSQTGYDDATWYAATVPGTVLTTLIDRGVYPDPDHGLDNMAIPESLARQDYWYRTTFTPPAAAPDRRMSLTFKGINYAAEVWLNGARLGAIRGAFMRGTFDVTRLIRPGRENVLAVRIAPPPHPGIPSEESITYGPGENGGSMALDGPTFIASEGWDWIPGIRDRDAGLWQDVELRTVGQVRIGDSEVITRLPLPRVDSAELKIVVPLVNDGDAPCRVTVIAAFEGVEVRKTQSVAPGASQLEFTAADFPELRLQQPRLWWPNGYGPANLYHLKVSALDEAGLSDVRELRFGIRELTYELSLFDQAGALRRVEIDPTLAALRDERLVDVRHEALKQVPNGWAASLTAAGEVSPAVRDVASVQLTPFLVIRVNGVPIAARGGSWGMDDSRKRISRARLEPYFRLHREAHVNIIRNWLGQNTEDVFYDLADEYGLLVLNDFWVSTQDFQLEPEDPALFLANARDVIARYRHHPSIALWFGRNEGVPQPILNEGLAELVATLDGTRYYTGSSNRVNLQDSGPYNYRPPVGYFTGLAAGFSVEVGTPSLATLETIEATVPAAERWPLSDTLAYHDWHFGGNGDVASFMRSLQRQFGAPTGLADFERKAQMMNYVDYRAIFEGFQANLWTKNSGRLLWMTHPAWPSNHWQMYSADYDTQASYYGVKKAAEPVHVQMNLPDYALAVVNTTREPLAGLKVESRVLSLDNRLLAQREDHLDAPANQVVTLAPLALAPLLDGQGVVFVALTLSDAAGHVLSENFYWQARDEAATQRLDTLPAQRVRATVSVERVGQGAAAEYLLRVGLQDAGNVPALAVKLTVFDRVNRRVLPAYFSDNYLMLLPGARREIEIRCPATGLAPARIALRGWNVVPETVTAGAIPP